MTEQERVARAIYEAGDAALHLAFPGRLGVARPWDEAPDVQQDVALAQATAAVVAVRADDSDRVQKAIDLIFQYGGIDGSHHKQWTLDQALRILAGDRYDALVKEACAGDDGPDTYEWDVGIPP